MGHALVAALTPHADEIDKISILPRNGGIGGFTRFWPEEDVVDSECRRTISLRGYPQGLYFIQVNTKDGYLYAESISYIK